jgi:hypothetical protein
MLTIGFQKRGVQAMEIHIVQGFLRLLLNEQEAEKALLRVQEKQRFLIPREVSYYLRKEIKKEVTDQEKKNMQLTWIDFCRKKNIAQDTCFDSIDYPVLKEWWGWVNKNYQQPLPDAGPWGAE